MPIQPVPGRVLAGKYRIDEILGRGGMGVVLAVTHVTLGQRHAMKLLGFTPDDVSVERFVREARAAATIDSENVARVHDVGTLDDGTPYMVMELLDGADLDSILRESGPLPVPIAVGYLMQACAALAEAHAAGLVHRDVKPSNLFLTRRADGSRLVKLLDFGISKEVRTGARQLTSAGTIIGSPHFMAPEQLVSSSDVDLRADVWSLGATLFELLAGATPFTGDGATEIFASVLRDEPRSLRELRPEAPAGLEKVILRCLRKDPADRFESAAALARALAPYVALADPLTDDPSVDVAAPTIRAGQSVDGIPRLSGDDGDRITPTATLEPEPTSAAPTLARPPRSAAAAADPRHPALARTYPAATAPGFVTPIPHPTPASSSMAGLVATAPPRPRRRWLVLVTVVLLVTAAAVAGWVLGSRRDDRREDRDDARRDPPHDRPSVTSRELDALIASAQEAQRQIQLGNAERARAIAKRVIADVEGRGTTREDPFASAALIAQTVLARYETDKARALVDAAVAGKMTDADAEKLQSPIRQSYLAWVQVDAWAPNDLLGCYAVQFGSFGLSWSSTMIEALARGPRPDARLLRSAIDQTYALSNGVFKSTLGSKKCSETSKALVTSLESEHARYLRIPPPP
jgi:eukaryotic-like serine/threonine-protein kinase